MTDKLLPCPFCGGMDIEVEREGTQRQSCIVRCGMCGCSMESGEHGYGRAWNTRATTDRKEVKRLREGLDYCSGELLRYVQEGYDYSLRDPNDVGRQMREIQHIEGFRALLSESESEQKEGA